MRLVQTAYLLGALALGGCHAGPSGLTLTQTRETPAAMNDRGSMVQVERQFTFANRGGEPVTISDTRYTISTVIRLEPGDIPPVTIEPGAFVDVILTGKNHSTDSIVRKAWLVTDHGEILMSVTVPGRVTAAASN